jgi:hypothetical protein
MGEIFEWVGYGVMFLLAIVLYLGWTDIQR